MLRHAGLLARLLLAAAAPASLQAGELFRPVAGPVLRAFGSPGDGGPAAGVTYDARTGATVLSPCRGRVSFAAPFRSYGRLVILDCGGGTDLVLAGLGSLTVTAGRKLRAGQAVGRMGRRSGRSSLYLELRRHGQPTDPAPYMTDHPS